jgi:hypothetical protein
MLAALVVLLRTLGLLCSGHRAVALENVALRQQLRVLRRNVRRPHLRIGDRLFWVLLAKAWQDWRTALIVVRPDTVVRWHRQWLRRRWAQRSTRTLSGPPEHDCSHSDTRRPDDPSKSSLGSPALSGISIRVICSRFAIIPSSHVQSHFGAPGHGVLRLPIPSRSPDRDPGPPSSAWRAAPVGTKAPRTDASRPDTVGLALAGVGRLTADSRHRQARDGNRLASQGVPTVLDVERASRKGGKTDRGTRDQAPRGSLSDPRTIQIVRVKWEQLNRGSSADSSGTCVPADNPVPIATLDVRSPVDTLF